MSSHTAVVVTATAIPLVLVGVLIWLWTSVLPKQRRLYASHPERRPYGRGLLLRMAPFISIGVVALVSGILTHSVTSVVLGGVMLAGFLVGITQRWNPPGA